MTQNRLKLNPDKSKFLLVGTPVKWDALAHHFPLDILGSPVSPCDSAKSLGVLFDFGFTFSNHISNLCRTRYINIRILCRVRHYLSFTAAIILVDALVSSRLDYCNSLLTSCTGNICDACTVYRILCVGWSTDCPGMLGFLVWWNHSTGSKSVSELVLKSCLQNPAIRGINISQGIPSSIRKFQKCA